jgi:nitric oxide reductase NorE protein
VSTVEATRDPSPPAGARIPGESGIWVFICGEMAAFTVLFVIWLASHGEHPDLFAAGQRALTVGFGAVDTLLLLASSLFVVIGVRAVRRGVPSVGPGAFAAAIGCGLGFSVSKLIEWGGHIAAGQNVHTDEFWMYYYVLTGMHFFHLLIGMSILVWCLLQARKPALSPQRYGLVEGGACFWHMVDFLWIVLFPLIYLVR